MTRHSMATTLGLTLFLVACGGDTAEEAPSPDDAPPSPEAALDDPIAGGGIQRITGFVLIGRDRQDFQACAGGPEYWVDGPGLPDILELHAAITPGREPYESIFVDVLAAPGSPPSSGPGSTLAGRLDVLEVRRAAFEGWGCRAVDDDLVVEARGNEPFWILQVTTDGTSFQTPTEQRTFEAGEPAPSPEGWRVTGTTDTGAAFTLVLEVGGCSDTMSGAWSHLAARLEMGDEVLEGCGFLGVEGEG